jgi:hypothetical protein
LGIKTRPQLNTDHWPDQQHQIGKNVRVGQGTITLSQKINPLNLAHYKRGSHALVPTGIAKVVAMDCRSQPKFFRNQ